MDIENSIVLVKDYTECQKCMNRLKASKCTHNSSHLEHLVTHLNKYKTQCKKLDTMLYRDNTLCSTVKNDIMKRKQAILDFLLSNETCLRTKVALEKKIIQLDTKLTMSSGSNIQFKSRVLDAMESLKREMFILDDIILCHS